MMKLPSVLLLLLATIGTCCGDRPFDCKDIQAKNSIAPTGVYTIYPMEDQPGIRVYCDMNTQGGGWTVFQRRFNGTLNFFRRWNEYVDGFGDPAGEYWLGLEYVHRLTILSCSEMLLEMTDFENEYAYQKYGYFRIFPLCRLYEILVGSPLPRGGAVAYDVMRDTNGMKFTTYDRDHDNDPNTNCAQRHVGAWWYRACYRTNPNGPYFNGKYRGFKNTGLEWLHWKHHMYSLKECQMMVRRKL